MSTVQVTRSASLVQVTATRPQVAVGTPSIVSASAVPFTPAGGIAATNVQAAIAELDAEKQPLDANLSALAALTSAADTVPYFTGPATAALAALTAFGRSLIAGADAAAVRTTLGLGSLALASSVTASQISDSTAAGRTLLTAADVPAQLTALGLPGLATSGITGTLTLSKTGTTARTATFPDAAITVAGSASALTSGRVPYVTTGGLLTDTATFGFTGESFFLAPTDATVYSSSAAQGDLGARFVVNNINNNNDRIAQFVFRQRNNAAYDCSIGASGGSSAFLFFKVLGTERLGISSTAITATLPVTVPNGTAAAPGLRTTTYAHGLHSIGATSVGIDVAGALVLTVGATASSFASGTTVQFSNTTTAGNGTGSVICNGGGYFAKAVFAANDASGVHYYGNSGLTMRDLGTGTSTYLDLAFGSASHGAYNIRSSNAATVRFNIDTSGHVTLGGTAGNYLNINNATGELRINGTKVSGPRDTGWTAMTGTTDKATAYDTATVTLPQLAGRVMALQAALTAHGKIGT